MRSNPSRYIILILAAAALGSVTPVQADWRVWTLTETQHVLRSKVPGDALEVKLAAARNEFESFQILLRSDAPNPGVRVEPGDLRGPNGAVLSADQAGLFRQHQLFLEIGTSRNDAFKPDGYPDPLIPFQHPAPGKNFENARFRAVPFDLPANETHAFWVDLFVPANAPAGEYRGAYHVTAANGMTVEIPVALTVWDFSLPRVSTLVTAFGSPAGRLRDYYRQRAQAGTEPEPTDWEAIETQCAQMLTEHRFNATPPRETLTPVAQSDGSFQIPSKQVDALREFADRYHVNALEIPHPQSAVKDPDQERDQLRAWLAAFDRAAKDLARPQIVFYTYLKDEPNTLEDYRYVQKWGRAVREASSVVQVMVVEQTWTAPGQSGADNAWGDLYGAVDIWCPLFSLQRPESAAQRQALGETIWTYTALCQGQPTPWWHIDYPLLNYRVPAWIAWRDHMKGLLYWGGMSYWRQVDDPWTQAPIYTGDGRPQQGKKSVVFNGEGSLVYPARAVGYDGIVPTIRLKALRDAIEDFEYLAILDRAGKTVEADKIVRPLAESWFQWEKNPAAYETARRKLAELILDGAKRSFPSSMTGEPSSGSPTQDAEVLWKKISPFFQPPPELAGDFGTYPSPLKFYDGTPVSTPADWPRRRREILDTWHNLMGPWPPLIEKPRIEYLKTEARDNFTQHHLRLEVAPGKMTDDAYLLIPGGEGPFPAVVVVFYDALTGIGKKGENCDFAYQLAKRGFVTLSLGSTPESYYPDPANCRLQPLSYHAYEAATCYNALAALPQVDPQRIGIVGHSYGSKWAMFASCLFDKFACAVWSDGGIVFDEKRPNVNYWEPWYLGFDRNTVRQPGIPSEQNPRTGPYKRMMETGRDLHELHALMAPRPFLVSGGSEDTPERWRALNHSVAVNRFLGYENRVAMTNRTGHRPTLESNEQMYIFLEYFLKHDKTGIKP